MTELSLYLHLPYCSQRCSYCDFNAHLLPEASDGLFEAYTEAMLADIAAQSPARLHTLFLGGGTPSLWPAELLERILLEVQRRFEWPDGLEATIELNPGTSAQSKLDLYRRMGLTRVSVGAQSFEPKHLQAVGRSHTPESIEETVRMARKAGFSNISLDLIYGFPEQTPEEWSRTLQRSLALEPEHLAVYQLTVEPGTRLQSQLARGELELPPEEDFLAFDEEAESRLLQASYLAYELSNWAKPGRESLHNLVYWTDRPYLGLGCGAASYQNGWRWERIKAPLFYQRAIAQGRSPVVAWERRDNDGALKDTLMMGLRTTRGVDFAALAQRYRGFQADELLAFFEGLPSDWWELHPGGVRLTKRGWDLHSEITMQLMDVLFSFS